MTAHRKFSETRERRHAKGDVTAEHVARARANREAAVLAYKLAQLRKNANLTQRDVADAMGVTQVRVSDIERGNVSRTEVDTLARYVHAVGGRLALVAEFGDITVTIDADLDETLTA